MEQQPEGVQMCLLAALRVWVCKESYAVPFCNKLIKINVNYKLTIKQKN